MAQTKEEFLAHRREYHRKNKDRLNALARARRKINPDRRYRNDPKRKAWAKKYFEKTKDAYNEKRRQLRKENPEKYRKLQRDYYKENIEKVIKKVQNYYKKNKEQKSLYNKKYISENKEKIALQKKERRKKFSEHFKKLAKKNYLKNREKIRERYQKNSEKNAARRKELHLMNPEKRRKRAREFLRIKRLDPTFRAVDAIRRRINNALKSQKQKKQQRTLEYVGCTVEELKKHLEKQFKPGMNWSNQGMKGLQIDHIKPVSKYDLSKIEEQKKCFNYKNLQPLWWIDNLKKSNK